jgi:hypothetical protein
MTVHRLIYASRVARHVRFADAQAIAEAAVERNTANALSGMLVYTPSHFIQVLEGEDTKLRETLERIQRDDRHSDLHVIDARQVTTREFYQWAMVARQLRDVRRDFQQLDVESALDIFRRVRSDEP